MNYNQKPCMCPGCLKSYYNQPLFDTISETVKPLSQNTRFNMLYMHDVKALGDCAYKDYNLCRHPIPQTGSPYKVYNWDGTINKALPLTYLPPIGQTFPGAVGQLIPDLSYNMAARCPEGEVLMDGRGPCIDVARCKKMGGMLCMYNDNHNTPNSCYTKPYSSNGLIKYTCPLPIKKTQ